MPLIPLARMLATAQANHFAVGAFNGVDSHFIDAIFDAAKRLSAPVIINVAEVHLKFFELEDIAAYVKYKAASTGLPVTLNLDHGVTLPTVKRAIAAGFTSVMFDGSALSLADNLKKTKEITRIAHSLGISVEGELGYIGQSEAAADLPPAEAITAEIAADFVTKTKIDALAVAVGTNHGAVKVTGGLNIMRLAELNHLVDVPLVLHGGSKLSREDCRLVIDNGICKINIATDMSLSAAERLKMELAKAPAANYIHLMTSVKKGVKDLVRKYMLNFDCISRAI